MHGLSLRRACSLWKSKTLLPEEVVDASGGNHTRDPFSVEILYRLMTDIKQLVGTWERGTFVLGVCQNSPLYGFGNAFSPTLSLSFMAPAGISQSWSAKRGCMTSLLFRFLSLVFCIK